MSWEQRNEYFCKAQTDMQLIYIEAEREVKQLKAENARLKQELESVGTAAYMYGRNDLADENSKLREKVQRQADELTALRKAIEQRNSELRPWKRQAERFVAENASLRMLATHALKHIIEFECEADNREQFQGKPCEWCVYHGSSDCPKIIAVMYGELGVEVPDV